MFGPHFGNTFQIHLIITDMYSLSTVLYVATAYDLVVLLLLLHACIISGAAPRNNTTITAITACAATPIRANSLCILGWSYSLIFFPRPRYICCFTTRLQPNPPTTAHTLLAELCCAVMQFLRQQILGMRCWVLRRYCATAMPREW